MGCTCTKCLTKDYQQLIENEMAITTKCKISYETEKGLRNIIEDIRKSVPVQNQLQAATVVLGLSGVTVRGLGFHGGPRTSPKRVKLQVTDRKIPELAIGRYVMGLLDCVDAKTGTTLSANDVMGRWSVKQEPDEPIEEPVTEWSPTPKPEPVKPEPVNIPKPEPTHMSAAPSTTVDAPTGLEKVLSAINELKALKSEAALADELIEECLAKVKAAQQALEHARVERSAIQEKMLSLERVQNAWTALMEAVK